MRVTGPMGYPWNPADQLSPANRNGVNEITVGWNNLVHVISVEIPAFWTDIIDLLK